MGVSTLFNLPENKQMERDRQPSSSSRRTERKIIEKNRRNKMKHLYSLLNSLLPAHPSDQEPKSLPDQIDGAIAHIKFLETAVNEAKKRKENLLPVMGKKRSSQSTSTSKASSSNTYQEIPRIDVRVNDFSLQVVLVSGSHNHFFFSEILRMLQEEDVEVISANFSFVGNLVYHLVHAKIGESNVGAATIAERLKELVNGFTAEDEDQFHPNLWEFQMSQGILWNFWNEGTPS